MTSIMDILEKHGAAQVGGGLVGLAVLGFAVWINGVVMERRFDEEALMRFEDDGGRS